jgi:hypothetical protein
MNEQVIADLAGELVPSPKAERFVTGGSFILDEPAEVPALWGEGDRILWAEGEPFMICGPPGLGKTTLAQQIALRRIGLLSGDLLGLPVKATDGRLLYLAADRPRQAARSFRRMVTEEQRELLDDRLVVWRGPPPGDFAKHPDLLLELCEKADAQTVILDSLKDVAVGIAADEVGAGVNLAIQTATAEGVDGLSLHHQRKGDGTRKPKTLSDVFGSVWLTAGMGSVALLWGDAGDAYVELLHLKQPAADVGPLTLRHDHDTGTTTVVDGVDLVELARATPGGVTATDAARAVFDTEVVSRNETERIRRRLAKLTATGELVEVPGSRGGSERHPTRWRTPNLHDLEANQ